MAEQRLDSILKTSQANCPGLDDDSPPSDTIRLS